MTNVPGPLDYPIGDRMRGAWLGLFAADLMAADGGREPSAATASSFSMPACEAAETILALDAARRFDLTALHEGLVTLDDAHPESDFSHLTEVDGGLIRCLAVSLWFRSRSVARLLEALDECVSMTDVPVRGRIATLALCLWTRELHRERSSPSEAWARNVDAWSRIFLGAGYDAKDVESLLAAESSSPAQEADLALRMVQQLRQCAEAATLESCFSEVVETCGHRRSLLAAAGLIFGMAKSDAALPETWTKPLQNMPEVARTLVVLLEKQRAYPNLQQNPSVTSENCPLFFSFLDCRKGRLLLTTAPGASMTVGYSDRGIVQIDRDMAADIARISETGATDVLTLLRADELMDAGMTTLRMAVEAAGLKWRHLPVMADDFPDTYFKQDLAELGPKLQKVLDAGGSIVVHAHDWHGRLSPVLRKLIGTLDYTRSTTDIAAQVDAAIALGRMNDSSLELA